tara:strand:- start:147 stop:398 length:252 start_codon:yes stop_codon:yes gene_type:complete
MTRTYYVMPKAELSKVDFDKTCFLCAEHCPVSQDESQVVIKWDGDEPSFISSIEGGVEYNKTQIVDLLNTDAWSDPIVRSSSE